MHSNRPNSSLLLHRINPLAPDPTNSTSSIPPTTRKQSQPLHYYCPSQLPEYAVPYHSYLVGPDQCCSAVIQEISAPVSTVWSVVRRFDNPQAYKHFVKSCHVIVGDGNVGTLREVQVISGLPAANSTERLEILDEEHHVISFSVVGGDHRLSNYRSVTSLHQQEPGPDENGSGGTVVIESYIADIPIGNTEEETSVFVDTIVKCNLQSLAKMAEDLARRNDCKRTLLGIVELEEEGGDLRDGVRKLKCSFLGYQCSRPSLSASYIFITGPAGRILGG